MIATIVNAAAVIVGGVLGLLLRRWIADSFRDPVLIGIGTFTLVIGMSLALETGNPVLLAVSLVAGGLLGYWMRIEDAIHRFGASLARFSGSAEEHGFASAFLNATVLFCVGALAIVGSIEAGASGDYTLILTKSLLDGNMAILLTAAQGPGVIASALSILLYQGTLTLLAGFLQDAVPPPLLTEIGAIGGVLILMIGINLLDLRRIPTANFLPALVLLVAGWLLLPLLGLG